MKHPLAFLFAVLSSLNAFAADDPAPATDHTPMRGFVAIQPIGYGPNDAFSAGLISGFWIDEKSQLVLELMTGLYNVSYGENSAGRNVSRKGNTMGFHYRRFVTETIYLKGGLDLRYFDYSERQGADLGSFESRSYSASFAIGSQWQRGKLVFGCDWIGSAIPFGTEFRNEVRPTTSAVASYVDDAKSKVTGPVRQALRFHLEMTF